MKRYLYLFSLFSAAALLIAFAGCDGTDVFPEEGGGTVRIKMTDAPLDGVDEANVTITRVELVGEDESVVLLSDEDQSFDLLELQDGVEADLAEDDVPDGEYHQLRIIVEEEATLVFEDGSEETLKIPSGAQTGIKINLTDFSIDDDADEVEILIDFDASNSFHEAGNSGKWIFKPVIHVKDIQFNGEDLDDLFELTGEITAASDTSVSVEGIDFALTDETEIEEGVTLEAGQFVELGADLQDSMLVALEIDGEEAQDHARIKAPIEQLDAASLIVLSTAFAITADTEFEGISGLTDLLTGDVVWISFDYDATTGAYNALEIELQPSDDD